jgi:aspartate-semialdehyde dehydrogenase
MAYTLAIVGATGTVGREILTVLAERGFPPEDVTGLASRESIGTDLSYGFEHTLKCKAVEHHDFSNTDIAIFVAGPEVAEKWAPVAAKAGAVVIDNSSFYRLHDTVPLVAPEANADALEGFAKRRIVASPSGVAAQLSVVLKPLHDYATAKRVVVDTYQSVSDAGNAAMDELFQQTRGIFVNDPIVAEQLPKQIAFNVIPQIDDMLQDGSTREERRLAQETHKILGAEIAITATCVRVPVFVGNAMAVHIEFEREITVAEARRLLRAAPGCIVIDKREDGGYMTPVEAIGEFATFISRIREDKTVEHGLSLWTVADNLRNAAALTAVQTAEILAARYLRKAR